MKRFITSLYLLSLLFTAGCGKDFLEKRSNKALLVPTTLADFRLIMDNTTQLFDMSPGLNVLAGDEFEISATTLAGLTNVDQNTYLWAEEIFNGTGVQNDWNTPYRQVFFANIVLEGLAKLNADADAKLDEWKALKGSALFQRAFAFYNLSQSFAPVYRSDNAKDQLGIPIRLVPDVNAQSTRSTLQHTYEQIILDLKESIAYLPLKTAFHTRPPKAAAYAMLARVYLSMSEFVNAEKYADSALMFNSALLDYNTLDPTGTARRFPSALPKGNPEIIFYSAMPLYSFVANAQVTVSPTLYNSYAPFDLRKPLFYKDLKNNGIITLRGSYCGVNDAAAFAGLATDELYLIKAECLARKNDPSAMQWLNNLLVKRFKTNNFVPLQAADAEAALRLILAERKKELVARGLRWTDLRRLNLDPRFSVTLSRTVNGQDYVLLPNSKRYVFQIPPEEILGSDILQNER